MANLNFMLTATTQVTIPTHAFSGILSIYTLFSLSISHTGIEVGLQQTVLTVTEGMNETVTVCVEFLAGDTLEKNVTVLLTTQDGSATGQGRVHNIICTASMNGSKFQF